MPSSDRKQLVVRSLLLALIYFLLSIAGRFLALPPGFASPVWPAAGIAASALLIWGLRCWPGILLGSCLYNMWLSYQTSNGLLLLTPVLIGTGATLQALVAARAGSRFLEGPSPFSSQTDAFSFLLLTGPAACLISSTLGVSTLVMLDLLPRVNLLNQWVTWWSGDTLGVLLFMPLVFIASIRTRYRQTIPLWSTLLPLCIIAVLVIGSLLWLDNFAEALQLNTLLYKLALGLISVTLTLMMVASLVSTTGRQVSIAEEVERRKKVEKALLENQTFLTEAEKLAQVSGWRIDVDTMTFESTPAISRMFDFPEGHKMTMGEINSYQKPESLQVLLAATQKAIETGAPFDMELEAVTSKGRNVWMQVYGRAEYENGKVARLHGATQNITQRRMAEYQNNRSLRLQAIGTLSGGIAHDLNNTLTPILLLMDVLKAEFPEKAGELLLIEQSAQHAAGMVKHLLTFAKGAEASHSVLSVNQLLLELTQLISRIFPKNIKIGFECPNQLPSILGDRTLLHQVLLNICVNARDAMPNGGEILVKATVMEIADTSGSFIPEAKNGQHVCIQVNDTGSGISPEVMARIFDPFFTTKGTEKGAGLGLSTALGIIRSHQGFMKVDSTPGAGTHFHLYFPIAQPAAPEKDPSPQRPIPAFSGKLLFVDDDAPLRQMAFSVLSLLGFTPIIAANGAEALDILNGPEAADIRLIITDLHMPDMDGYELVTHVRQHMAAIPIIICSGFLEDEVAEQFKQLGVTVRVDKPFRRQNLQTAIAAALATA